MPQLNELPDLGRSAKLFKIAVELETVREDTIMGYCIKSGLKEGKTGAVIKMIRDQAKDNRPAMAHIVGNELLKEIELL